MNGLAKLQSLLMLGSPGICQRSFVDFVSSEDQDQFRSYTDREAGSINKNDEMETQAQSQAQSCHLHLVDRWGVAVAVQLFCSALPDHDGKPMYFLGIREE